MTVLEERLAQSIEVGAKRRVRYSTDVVTADGGWEVRNERWSYPLFAFDFSFMPGDPGDESDPLHDVTDFFHIVGGSAGTFLFRDWNDWRAFDQVLGVIEDGNTYFQLYRNYQRGNLTRRRLITRPIEDSIILRVDGLTTTFEHVGKGLINLTGGPYDEDAVVAADFDFHILVRFENDELEYLSITGEIEQPVDLTLLEVREEAEAIP